MTAPHAHRPATSAHWAGSSAMCNRSYQLALLRAGVIALLLLGVLALIVWF
jgi:hypothetical protein